MAATVLSSDRVLSRLRTFLLALSAFMALGTIFELVLTEHWEGPPQILPFILCALSFLVIVAVLFKPSRGTIRIMRWVTGITFLGSLFGVFEHLEHNFGFAQEIQPNAASNELLWKTLSGANPLLAPGILAFLALLALAATYYHPALQQQND